MQFNLFFWHDLFGLFFGIDALLSLLLNCFKSLLILILDLCIQILHHSLHLPHLLFKKILHFLVLQMYKTILPSGFLSEFIDFVINSF